MEKLNLSTQVCMEAGAKTELTDYQNLLVLSINAQIAAKDIVAGKPDGMRGRGVGKIFRQFTELELATEIQLAINRELKGVNRV
jgi:hypothetical protein